MTTATHWALPKRILIASLLAAIGLLAASCGSSSDRDSGIVRDTFEQEPTTSLRDNASDTDSVSTSPTVLTSTSATIPRAASSSIPFSQLGSVVDIAAGDYHTCALHQTGLASCWGSNRTGQLGSGESSENSSSARPLQVLGIADAAAVSAGDSHSCALHENGTISCWGENGPLGTDLESSPAAASSEQINFTAQSGSAARKQNLALAAEQPSLLEQIDTYTTLPPPLIFTSEPIAVPDITDAIAVSAGGYHTCALHQDNTVACWGNNRYGQLGNGDSGSDADTTQPVKVAGIDDAIAVSAGRWNTCALHKDSSISCWGQNYWGESSWSARGRIQPTAVKVGNISDAIAVSAGGDHACALHEDATISCWGNNADGKLALGIDGNISVLPITVL